MEDYTFTKNFKNNSYSKLEDKKEIRKRLLEFSKDMFKEVTKEDMSFAIQYMKL